MTPTNDSTLAFYSREAEAYAAWSIERDTSTLDGFMALLKPGARILELGCGGGHDAGIFVSKGFDVVATDGSPEMARQAEKRLGRPVRVMRFDELDAIDAFDGIWANACLLHAPRVALASILAGIHRALKPEGVFYASFKSGEAEGTDTLGRRFNYPDMEWLQQQFAALAWSDLRMERSGASGYDGIDVSLIIVWARR